MCAKADTLCDAHLGHIWPTFGPMSAHSAKCPKAAAPHPKVTVRLLLRVAPRAAHLSIFCSNSSFWLMRFQLLLYHDREAG